MLETTDMHITEEEVIRIYGKRWGIEVFFKVCKSYLRLERDCRAVSYDAMTAHVSIVFTRYMFLAVEQRESKDERSLGELFYLLMDELLDICLAEAVRLLVSLFVERLQEQTMLDEQETAGRLLSRAAVAVVTKTAKMYITNVFFSYKAVFFKH